MINRLTCSATVTLLLIFLSQSPQIPQPQEKIRTRVNEVIVPVTVTNKSGNLILDLSQKDFHIFDNGVEQSITAWDLGGDPLAVALVIETSSRIQAIAPAIYRMSSIFTESVMALNGEAAVITYDSGVEVHQLFTNDHEAIGKAISGVKFEVSQRKLYDGMAKAVNLLRVQPSTYRRIMLVVGESADDGSDTTLSQVVRNASNANISIYAVGTSSVAADFRGDSGIAPLKVPGLPTINAAGPAGFAVWLLERGTSKIKNHQLEVAAAATGGVHYRTFRDATIAKALDTIGGEIHAQYVLSYTPTKDPRVGFNEIKVTVSRPELLVRTRPGYYVPPAQ
nr:VWA domain-containing protein [Candidatus Acidoferrales bacterium]